MLFGLLFRLALCLPGHLTPLSGDEIEYDRHARNLLAHGTFSGDGSTPPQPRMTRTPGYPIMLAAVYAVFGPGRGALSVIQALLDLAGLLAIAQAALSVGCGRGTRRLIVCLGATCPFTAAASGQVMTEVVSGLLLCLTMLLLAKRPPRSWRAVLALGSVCAAAALVRPDMVLLAGITAATFVRKRRQLALFLAVLLALMSPWAIRNHLSCGQATPLSSRFSVPRNVQPAGFMSWARTWAWKTDDLSAVIWPYFGGDLNSIRLPDHATDSEEERRRVLALLQSLAVRGHAADFRPVEDEFSRLAAERRWRNPLREFATLPLLRMGRMWISSRSGGITQDPRLAKALLALDILFLAAALAGTAWLIERRPSVVWVPLSFVATRTVVFAYLGLFEPRYVLPCFHLLFVPAAVAMASLRRAIRPRSEVTPATLSG